MALQHVAQAQWLTRNLNGSRLESLHHPALKHHLGMKQTDEIGPELRPLCTTKEQLKSNEFCAECRLQMSYYTQESMQLRQAPVQ